MLLRLGQRNSNTIEWLFRKIRNYGPKDEAFLACDDLDIALEVATWAAEQQKVRGEPVVGTAGTTVTEDGIVERDIAPGVKTVRVETDPASWQAFVDAVERGSSPEEAFAAAYNAPSSGTEDTDEAERLMRDILGDRYTP